MLAKRQSPSVARKVDGKLLEILVCPQTGGPLQYDPKKNCLISPAASCVYPIRDGIPVMLIEEAEPLQKGKK